MKLHILNRHNPKHIKKHYNGKEVLTGFTAPPSTNKGEQQTFNNKK